MSREILLHHELDGLVETIGADGAEVDAALEVDADGVFTGLQVLVELLHGLANEVDDADVSFNILRRLHDHIVSGGVRIKAIDHILCFIVFRNVPIFLFGIDFDSVDGVLRSIALVRAVTPIQTNLVIALETKPEFARSIGVGHRNREVVVRVEEHEVEFFIGEVVNELIPVTFVNIAIAHINTSVVVSAIVVKTSDARSRVGTEKVTVGVAAEGRVS